MAAAVLAFLILLCGGAAIDRCGGFPGRLSPEYSRFASTSLPGDTRFCPHLEVVDIPDRLVQLGDADRPTDILVWGDSHAMSILPVFDSLCREAGVGGRGATHPGTAPVIGFFTRHPLGLNERAVPFSATVMDFIKTEKVRSVVMAAYWGMYCNTPGFADALLATVDALRAINVAVYFMIDVPVYPYDVPKALGLYSGQGRDLSGLALPRRDYEALNHFHTDLLPILRDRRVVVLDPVPVLQARSGSTALLPFDSGGSFYSDYSHLSPYGAMALRPLFSPVVTHARRENVASTKNP